MVKRFLKALQNLSIDVVIGAVILLRFFCNQLGLNPSWEEYVLLGSAIWLVYTLDHIKDAKRAAGTTRARYLFHRKYQKYLSLMVILVVFVCIVLTFSIERDLALGGLLIACCCFLYLFFHQLLSRFLLKEIYIACIYSAGVLLIPFVEVGEVDWNIFILLFLLASLNLLIFSWMEEYEDSGDGLSSVATEIGVGRTEKLILIFLSVGIAWSISNMAVYGIIAIYFFIALCVYGWIIIFPSISSAYHRYRIIGDGVFILPAFFELF